MSSDPPSAAPRLGILCADPVLRPVLCEILAAYAAPVSVLPAPENTAETTILLCDDSGNPSSRKLALGKDDLAFPLRAGFLIKKISRMLAENDLREKIAIGDFSLIVSESLLIHEEKPTEPPIRLTDKERDILLALERAPERTLDRKALLDEVWGYVEGVETHTLETHIYRLRQKIEPDPANPRILITDGQGYRLT